jgi:hypothetical protein
MNGKYWITGSLKPWKPPTRKVEVQQDASFSPQICCKGDTFVNSDAFTVCMDCGRVIPDAIKQFMFYMGGDASEGCSYYSRNPKNNTGVQMPTKRRFYQSKIHFMTHLKRYLGLVTAHDGVSQEIIDEVTNTIDVKDKLAYFEVRDFLKRKKLGCHYKDIFSIIYRCGGVMPNLDGEQMRTLERHINSIQSFFYANRQRWGKKSMPCVPWILERLLIRCGHEPHYCLHMLKAASLQKEAENFFQAYIEETDFI